MRAEPFGQGGTPTRRADELLYQRFHMTSVLRGLAGLIVAAAAMAGSGRRRDRRRTARPRMLRGCAVGHHRRAAGRRPPAAGGLRSIGRRAWRARAVPGRMDDPDAPGVHGRLRAACLMAAETRRRPLVSCRGASLDRDRDLLAGDGAGRGSRTGSRLDRGHVGLARLSDPDRSAVSRDRSGGHCGCRRRDLRRRRPRNVPRGRGWIVASCRCCSSASPPRAH